MPRNDAVKPAVVAALVKDGWTITADPLTLDYDEFAVGIDLGAERLLAASRGGERIAVEIKTFGGPSRTRDFRDALGQYDLYTMVLEDLDPDRKLYLAVSERTHRTVFRLKAVTRLVRKRPLPLLVVNTDTQEVVQWIA